MRGIGSPAPRPRRVDARRNREAILRAADEAYRTPGVEVTLEEVARRAGLGRATVYRHFADRRTLAYAVAHFHLCALDELARSEITFRELLAAILTEQVARRSLVTVFRDLPTGEQHRLVRALMDVLGPAFRRAQAAGEVRADVEPGDLELVFEMVEGAMETGPRETRRDHPTQRLIKVIVDGLFVTPDPALRG
ncbi:TetR/AcrR family transcriptional regulator [Actinokineospora bangkokensis]|uniref:HTH tetR-type domain-containing protein n=1 Tax=Actinokineospora bangkokensis TaxID=1193682 RepID=A0A1Q9LL90_9PSEU|nr:TetR/AcrR family transcriptional regulator [Actinokineospora bangkokensis]OLR92785.1 hypothetical protein BJP25_19335 [Actinokineospora bangkokensis]